MLDPDAQQRRRWSTTTADAVLPSDPCGMFEEHAVGGPISATSRWTPRTLEAYLRRAAARGGWSGSARSTPLTANARTRLAARPALRSRPSAPATPELPAPAAGARSPRRGTSARSTADRPAQRLVPDRARPRDGPAHQGLREDPRQLVPPRAARPRQWILAESAGVRAPAGPRPPSSASATSSRTARGRAASP